jgi:predicted nucleic acid-binding protein
MTERIRRIFLDTAPLVYFLEKDARYWDIVSPIFQQIDGGSLMAVTSPVTLAECLVLPYRQKNLALAQDFIDCVVNGDNTLFLPITEEMACKAAELRASYNLSLSDAFQVAACLVTGCDAFLTNDRVLKRVKEVNVLLLEEMK